MCSDLTGYLQYLDGVDLDRQINQINQFWQLNLKNFSEDEIVMLISATLQNHPYEVRNVFLNTIPARTLYYFRIRKPRSGITLDEGWFREPEEYRNGPQSRFDVTTTPPLYASLTYGGAAIETKTKCTDEHVEIVYTNVKDISMIVVTDGKGPFINPNWSKQLNKLQLKKANVINTFICKLMSIRGKNVEHRIARAAARYLYGDLNADGIMIKSTRATTGLEWNVTFFDSWDCLDIVYAKIHNSPTYEFLGGLHSETE